MRSQGEILKYVWDVQRAPIQLGGFLRGFIKLRDCGTCSVAWSDSEEGYEHVSVSPKKQFQTPTWDDMCQLKDIFFNDDEEVYQIHPPKKEYVDYQSNCLHLWRLCNGFKIHDAVGFDKR